MSSVRNRNISRMFGRGLALIFGLMLLIEVGCLPYFSSFAGDFEHSLIAEVADLEELEKAEEYRPDLDHLLPDFAFLQFPDPLAVDAKPWATSLDAEQGAVAEPDIFLLQRNFRL